MTLFGIDASSYQGNWDAAREHAAGLAFGIEKATQGTGYTNPDYAAMVAEMRAADLVPGAYHFTDGAGSGAAQGAHFVNVAGDGPGLILAQDVEALGKIGRAEVVDWFVEVNRLVPRRDMLCYTGQDFWNQITGHLDIRTVEDRIGQQIWLWDAGDGHRPNIYVPARGSVAQEYAAVSLAGWRPYGGWSASDRLFLQFTDHATEPGVSGEVDGDAFFGSLDQLRALAADTTPTAPPPPGDVMRLQKDTAGRIWKIGDYKQLFAAANDTEGQNAAKAWSTSTGLAIADINTQTLVRIPDLPGAATPVDVAALAADLATHLPPALDPGAVATKLAPLLHTGATVDDIKALLATLRVTAG